MDTLQEINILCWHYHYHLQDTWCDEGPMNDVSMDGPEGPMIGVVPWMGMEIQQTSPMFA